MGQTVLFQKSYDFYKQLYENLRSVNKRDRYVWGERCEHLALEILTLSTSAGFLPAQEKKALVHRLQARIDLLQVILRLGDDLRILDHKKYIARSGELLELGRMAGGWLKTLR